MAQRPGTLPRLPRAWRPQARDTTVSFEKGTERDVRGGRCRQGECWRPCRAHTEVDVEGSSLDGQSGELGPLPCMSSRSLCASDPFIPQVDALARLGRLDIKV